VKDYKTMLDKNENHSKEIKTTSFRINRLKEQITYWQTKQQQNAFDSKLRND
jgi:hypothetical protein